MNAELVMPKVVSERLPSRAARCLRRLIDDHLAIANLLELQGDLRGAANAELKAYLLAQRLNDFCGVNYAPM